MHHAIVRSLLAAALATAALIVGSVSEAGAAPAQPAKTAAEKASPQAPVDVNTASAAELISVPGIGKSLAARIVEFREKNGPFGRVDDLVKVRGIGEKSLERMRPYLTASAPRSK